MKEMTLRGFDSWDRAVYTDLSGNIWKTAEPVTEKLSMDTEYIKKICLYDSDEFDGEPGWPLEEDFEILLVSKGEPR